MSPTLAPFRQPLSEALRLGETHTELDLWSGIAQGFYHLWPGEQSAAVTELVDYPRARVLNVWLAGGDLQELLTVILPTIEDWAKTCGAQSVTVTGRRGWVRVLRDSGYGSELSLLSKAIT